MMVWLAQWIRENVTDARVVVITDCDELDRQIENGFKDAGEKIRRARSGNQLVSMLNEACSEIRAKYPTTLDTKGETSLVDNLNHNEELAIRVHDAVKANGRDGFRGCKWWWIENEGGA